MIAALVLVIVILQVIGDDDGQVAEPSEGPLGDTQDDLPHEQPEPDALPFAEDAVLLRRLLEAEESDGGVDYDRDAYQPGGWGDADGDGCNTREEVLIAEARSITQVDRGCRPIDGTWWSWYDEIELDDPGRSTDRPHGPVAGGASVGRMGVGVPAASGLRERPGQSGLARGRLGVEQSGQERTGPRGMEASVARSVVPVRA